MREPAKPVERFDRALRRLMDEMFATMYEANGVGLAAPQVGRRERVAVIDVDGLKAVNDSRGHEAGDQGLDIMVRHRVAAVGVVIGRQPGWRPVRRERVVGIAVLAALNLAHELQQLRDEGGQHDHDLMNTLTGLQRKLDGCLDRAAS